MARVAVVAALVCTSCSALEVLDFGMCGNGVLEPNALEDCDTNAVEGTCGAPETAGACRFVCAIDAECPGGRQCGKDGICRLPTRQFVLADGAPYASIGRRFTTADLDGDTNRDVIGTNPRGGVLLYGRGDTTFEQRTTLITGPPTAPLVTGHLSSAETRDIIAPVGRGLQITRADAERTLSPVAHAFDIDALSGGRTTVVLPLRVADLFDAVVVLVQTPADVMVIVRPPQGAISVPETTLSGFDLSELAGRPATGDIDGPSSDGTHELAVASTTGDQVRVFGLDCVAQVCSWTQRATVATPQGRSVTDGIALADADGDGAADLFLGVDSELYVARSRGDGTFEPVVEDRRAARACAECGGWPLAIDDIDGDRQADFVTAGGIVTTSSAAGVVRHRPSRSGISSWSLAAVADFDGDERKDVVVGARANAGVELALGSDLPFFNTFFFETTRPVFGISAADFDGDGLGDLAIVEGVTDASVSIAYGTVREPLSTPREMARFDRIVGAQPALAVGLGRDMIDFRADLLVRVVRNGDPPVDEFAVLIGTESKRMVAPALLGDEPDADERAHAVAAGRFDLTHDRDDLIAVSQAKLWLFGTDAQGGIDRSLLAEGLPAIDGTRDVIVTTAQLDGDDYDEVVIVSGAFPRAREEAVEPSLYIVDRDSAETLEVREIDVPSGMTAPSSVTVSDVDGSGRPVIVVAFTGGTSGVAIYRTNGGARVEEAPTVVPPDEGRMTLYATAANIDEDPSVEIVLLTDRDVISIELEEGAWSLGDAVDLGAGTPSDAAAIGAADFDDDGVTDLAIATDGGFFVYRALERVGMLVR